MRRLHRATVTVAGLGAVGSFAVETLARSGVGRFRLVDFDRIETTNLNRQLFALHSTLGRTKTAAASERVRDINPACVVDTLELFVSEDTLETVFAVRPDLVIDAIDSLTPKIQLLAYCHANGIPVLSSMGAALRTDPSHIRFGDLMKTHSCPLAERVRRALRKQGVRSGIKCVYSTQPPQAAGADPDELEAAEAPVRGRKRRVLGSMPTITGMFGLMLAHHAVDILSREPGEPGGQR